MSATATVSLMQQMLITLRKSAARGGASACKREISAHRTSRLSASPPSASTTAPQQTAVTFFFFSELLRFVGVFFETRAFESWRASARKTRDDAYSLIMRARHVAIAALRKCGVCTSNNEDARRARGGAKVEHHATPSSVFISGGIGGPHGVHAGPIGPPIALQHVGSTTLAAL